VTTPESLHTIDAVWAARIGCDATAFRGDGLTIVLRDDFERVYSVRRGRASVVLTPPRHEEALRDGLARRPAADCVDPAVMRRTIGGEVRGVVGPAWIGFADTTDLVALAESEARALTPADAGALERLRTACDETEWEHSGIAPQSTPVFGVFQGEALVAAASWELWDDAVAHIGVITHQRRRGRGHGRAVAGAIASYALSRGYIAQWQTLMSNAPSLAIARALGFRPRFETLSLRLTE
jgi:hypothetical protein